MIDRATVDKIMDATNIVEVVGDFVNLRKAGVNYKGLCPFHDDRHLGSFVVYPKGNCFKCFKWRNSKSFIYRREKKRLTVFI